VIPAFGQFRGAVGQEPYFPDYGIRLEIQPELGAFTFVLIEIEPVLRLRHD
jgi:hypothetical protein